MKVVRVFSCLPCFIYQQDVKLLFRYLKVKCELVQFGIARRTSCVLSRAILFCLASEKTRKRSRRVYAPGRMTFCIEAAGASLHVTPASASRVGGDHRSSGHVLLVHVFKVVGADFVSGLLPGGEGISVRSSRGPRGKTKLKWFSGR